MFLIQTFAIEDCVKCYNQTYSSNTTFDMSLPSHFKIEYELYLQSLTQNSCWLYVGESTSKALLCGKIFTSDSSYKIVARKSSDGSGDISTTCDSITDLNTWQPQTITYDGTTFTFRNTSITNLNTVSLNKLVSLVVYRDGSGLTGQIRNIKIKPL